RNLGWSGDTVSGRARRFFGSTDDGFKHLLDHLDLVKPTVIFVSYGTSEAFDGREGREAFQQGYRHLLDELRKRTDRIVIVTSPPLDPDRSPAPKLAKRVSEELHWQGEYLRGLAAEQGYAFIDLVGPLSELIGSGDAPGPLTDNGMHLTPLGYRIAGRIVIDQLGLSKGQW